MIIRFEKVPNRYGIMVNKNCASCANKCLDDFARRNCRLTRKMVRASNVCDSWQMSSQLKILVVSMVTCSVGSTNLLYWR